MRNAFSLVELSIVLVILGLLTGGILAGQSLIHASELRAVTADFAKYQAAIYSFRAKYFAIPGDMANATAFWGIAGGDGSSPNADCFAVDSSTLSDPRRTCNGNGNGKISAPFLTMGSSEYWATGERFRFWQHLSNAGLIEGQYSGRSDSDSDNWVLTPGKNVPASRYAGATHTVFSLDRVNLPPIDPSSNFSNTPTDNYMDIRLPMRTTTGSSASVLTAEDAWNIDSKLDDGRPAYGKIRAVPPTASHAVACSTSNDPALASYTLNNSAARCYMMVFF